jgi:hypothetical protein
MNRIIHKASALVLFALGLAVAAGAQSFNVDLDVLGGPSSIGNGAPSPSFGGAAGQLGFWNRLSWGGVFQPLRNTDNQATAATMFMETSGPAFFGGGFAFGGNTGDYALLLNDAAGVGPLLDGGDLTIRIEHIGAGAYELYTYAVNRHGAAVDTPVLVPGADPPETQIVTGPMPGNALMYLVTHSIHRVDVGSNGMIEMRFLQPPNSPAQMNVNGFQIVPVPEFHSGFVTGSACMLLIILRSHRGGS